MVQHLNMLLVLSYCNIKDKVYDICQEETLLNDNLQILHVIFWKDSHSLVFWEETLQQEIALIQSMKKTMDE